ncbi:hypothetical protein Tco_1089599 [Tanacetum coccineum]
MLRGPACDEVKVIGEKELEYDIALQNGEMQSLTPQIVHITSLDDDYVALATSPILTKHLNKFGEEFSDITRVAEKADGNPLMMILTTRRRKSQITLTRNRRGRNIVADAAIMTDFKGNEVAQEALDGNSSHIVII